MTITATDSSDPPKINITARDTSQKNETEEKKPRRRITWSDDTVDNEHMNKKSSKGKLIFYFFLYFHDYLIDLRNFRWPEFQVH